MLERIHVIKSQLINQHDCRERVDSIGAACKDLLSVPMLIEHVSSTVNWLKVGPPQVSIKCRDSAS